MLEGVIFDFNGTLFFDSAYHYAVFRKLKKRITGEDLQLAEMEVAYSGVPNVEIFKRMSGGSFDLQTCEKYSREKECMYRELVAKTDCHLCEGAEELFQFLKNHHIPFTIASASIKENIDFFVQKFHLDRWMDPNTIVYDDGTYTDKTAMFMDAKKKIGVENNVLVFEDSLSGIRSADAIGASLIVIYRENLKEQYDKYPSILASVNTMKEALPMVEKLL